MLNGSIDTGLCQDLVLYCKTNGGFCQELVRLYGKMGGAGGFGQDFNKLVPLTAELLYGKTDTAKDQYCSTKREIELASPSPPPSPLPPPLIRA